jgi:hypothetical protein
MGAAEHIGLANYAGGDGDGGDGRVEYRVRGGEEQLFQKPTIPSEDGGLLAVTSSQSWKWRWTGRAGGYVHDQGKLVYKFILSA